MEHCPASCRHHCLQLHTVLNDANDVTRIRNLLPSINARVCGLSLVCKALRKKCSVEILRQLLSLSIKLRAKTSDGDTLLHVAIESDCEPAVIRELLAQGVNGAAKNELGMTPLHLAVAKDRELTILNILLGQKKNTINFMDLKKNTALHLAASNPDCDIDKLRALVFAGGKGLVKNADGRTPLHLAASRGANRIVTELVYYFSTSVDIEDSEGKTPLRLAGGKCSSTVIRQLQRGKSCQFAWDGRTPLLQISAGPNAGQMLLQVEQLKPQVNVKDRDGNLPIHLALRNGCSGDVLKCLVGMGSHVDVPNKCGDLPFHLLLQNGGSVEELRCIMGTGDDVMEMDSNGNLAIHLALKNKCSFEVLQCLISMGSKVDVADKDGNLPIHLALVNGCSLESLQCLIEKEPNLVFMKNADGDIPIHLALKNKCSFDVLQYFIKMRSPIDIGDRDGYFPIHLALLNGCSLKVLQCLIERGRFLVTKKKNGYFPIHLGLKNKCSLEMLRYLISVGSPIGRKDIDGNFPIHLALLNGCSFEALPQLIEKEPHLVLKKNGDGYNPLQLALKNTCSLDILQYLIGVGSPIGAKDIDGNFPIHLAVLNGCSIEGLLILFQREPNLLLKKNKDGYLPIHLALKNKCSLEMLQRLNSMGSPMDTTDMNGNLPIHLALLNGCSLNVLQYLINSDLVCKRNGDGYLPIHLALQNGCSDEILQCLIDFGSEVTAETNRKQTCLHLAALGRCSIKVFEKLLSMQVNLNAEDIYGYSPMHLALKMSCSYDVFQCLLRYGSDLHMLHDGHARASCNSKCEKAFTCLNLALKGNCSLSIIEKLLEMDLPCHTARGWRDRSPLHYAVKYTYKTEIISALIKTSPDLLERKDNGGNTPLHLAVSYTYSSEGEALITDVVRVLIKGGANPIARNDDNDTPLHLSVWNNNLSSSVELLRDDPSRMHLYNRKYESPLEYAIEMGGEIGRYFVKYALLQDVSFWQDVRSVMHRRHAFPKVLEEFAHQCVADLKQLKKFAIGTMSLFDMIKFNYFNPNHETGPWKWTDEVFLRTSVRELEFYRRNSNYSDEVFDIQKKIIIARAVLDLRLFCRFRRRIITLDAESSRMIFELLWFADLASVADAFVPGLWNSDNFLLHEEETEDLVIPSSKKRRIE